MEVLVDGIGPVRGRAGSNISEGDPTVVLIRPEKLRLISAAAAGPADGLTGRLERMVRMGFVNHYRVRLRNDDSLLVYGLEGSGPEVTHTLHSGAAVQLSWNFNDARVFPAETGE